LAHPIQKINGSNDFICQKLPLASSQQLNNDEDEILSIPKSVEKDMQVWAAAPARASP